MCSTSRRMKRATPRSPDRHNGQLVSLPSRPKPLGHAKMLVATYVANALALYALVRKLNLNYSVLRTWIPSVVVRNDPLSPNVKSGTLPVSIRYRRRLKWNA